MTSMTNKQQTVITQSKKLIMVLPCKLKYLTAL